MRKAVTVLRSVVRVSRLVVVGVVALLAGGACRQASAPPPAPVSPDTWAVVDGRPITRADVDKAYLRIQDPNVKPSEEELWSAKLQVLNDLILQDILLAKAKALNLDVPAAELDTAFNDAKKNLPEEAFEQELTRRGVSAADMREGLRRELLAQKVIAREVTEKIVVTDQEVTDAFNANRAQFNLAEESYRVAQIAITPVREQQVGNASGDDATTPQEADAKLRMLTERLKAGASFRDLAVGFSEDPSSAPRGGDLGLIPVSKLKQAPPQLRDAVLNKEPGSVNVVSAGGAHTIVLVLAHEQAGQRDLSMPEVKTGITNTLKGRRDQLLRAAYLTSVRQDTPVVNYLARRLVESKGTAPSVLPAPPAAK